MKVKTKTKMKMKMKMKMKTETETKAKTKPGSGWGGRREGAGRPRNSPWMEPHVVRARVIPGQTLRVTMTLLETPAKLRGERVGRLISEVVASSQARFGLTIERHELSGRKLHLIIASADKVTLGPAMKGFNVRLARRLNQQLKRTGKLVGERYHLDVLSR